MKNTTIAFKAKTALPKSKIVIGAAVMGLAISFQVASLSSPAQAMKLYAQQNGNIRCSVCHSKTGLTNGTMYPLTSTGSYYKTNNKLPPGSGGGFTPPGGGFPPPGGGFPPPGGGFPPPGGGFPPPGGAYDGHYTGTRGYTDPYRRSPYRNCLNRYDISVEIRNGRATFYSDKRNWTGRVDARGEIHIDTSGVRPPPIDPISVNGPLNNARMHSGYCGGGYFRIFR